MRYILKLFTYSKYYDCKRVKYFELPNKEMVLDIIRDLRLERDDYEVFIKVI